MPHNPIIIQPNNPTKVIPADPIASEPTFQSNSPPYQNRDAASNRPLVNPEAALVQSLISLNMSKSIADRLPDLKKSAYILIGLVLFSAVQSLALESVLISALGAEHNQSVFFTTISVIVWMICILAAVIVLRTKSTTLVKKILLMFGVCLLYFTITDLMSFNIISLAINAFLVWWTYGLYQSVETLEI